MPETLEQKINAPQQEKKEEKPVSVLESVISETVGAVKAAANVGVAAIAPAAGYALTGNLGVPATSAAFIAGTKGKKDSKTIRNESLSGAIFGTFAHYTLAPLKYLANLGKIAYMSLWPFPANAFYMGEDHLVKNLSPKGMYKKFKENYWPIMKKTFKTLVPLNILSALFLPQQFMVASIAVASFIYRRFIAGGKGEEHTDKTPYYVAVPNVITKSVRNTVYGFSEAIRAMYSGIRDTLYKPTQATKPA